MPQKLDWADRKLFVASRDEGTTKAFVERIAAYERALARLDAHERKPKSTTTLDGKVVTTRQIKSMLSSLERNPPYKFHWFSPDEFDFAKYESLKAKYESALARCNGGDQTVMVNGRACTKSDLKSFLANSHTEVQKKNSGFKSWSQFVRGGPPEKPVTVLFCSPDLIRVFLKCSTKAQLNKLAKALTEESPYVVKLPWDHSCVCLFGCEVWKLNNSEQTYKQSDLKLLFLDAIDRERRKMESLRRKYSGEASRKLDPLREPIPESVRMYVWRRDEGKYVVCGSQDRLEFDHIIPVSKGGGNTERNIQLLCEQCNRAKTNRI